jgi:hypothetical protein
MAQPYLLGRGRYVQGRGRILDEPRGSPMARSIVTSAGRRRGELPLAVAKLVRLSRSPLDFAGLMARAQRDG